MQIKVVEARKYLQWMRTTDGKKILCEIGSNDDKTVEVDV